LDVTLNNSLLVSLDKNIFISKETCHQVIKGSDKLIIEIRKFI